MSHLGQPTPIPDITNNLRALWETDQAKSRAALMNLVIYAEDGTTLDQMAAEVEQVGAEHACRALIISANPCAEGAEQPPKAWITAHCRLGGTGGGEVCCEQIAFELCARDTNQLRNLVFAHLDSDLPLIFWWQGELSDSFEPRLYSRFDRLIVDSDTWSEPAAALARASLPNDYVLHDLAWSRTHSLRLAIADCFETPSANAALGKVSEVEITHDPAHSNTAALLSAWIARGLEWDELRRAATICYTKEAGAPVSRVSIEAGDCRFEITAGADAVRTSSRLGHREIDQVLPAAAIDDAGVVSELLARGGDNDLYLKTIAIL